VYCILLNYRRETRNLAVASRLRSYHITVLPVEYDSRNNRSHTLFIYLKNVRRSTVVINFVHYVCCIFDTDNETVYSTLNDPQRSLKFTHNVIIR